MIFRNGLLMVSIGIDTYLHIIGIELLVMLAIVRALIDAGKTKRVLSTLFLTVFGFMLAHFATHILPNTIAEFVYGSYHEYQSVNPSGLNRK